MADQFGFRDESGKDGFRDRRLPSWPLVPKASMQRHLYSPLHGLQQKICLFRGPTAVSIWRLGPDSIDY